MSPVNWQTLHLPFGVGLNQKSDPRALNAPALSRCVDVQFDETGGLQTRYPFSTLGNEIFGGGTIENARRGVPNGDELLQFTDTALYSWNATVEKWVRKGTYLAVKVEEQPVFVNSTEQIECDRAELAGTIVYCWTEQVGASSKGYVAAVDKVTGSVLMAPTSLAGSAERLRVTALEDKILLSFYDGVNGLYAYALDPATPATALGGASTTLTNTNFGEYYDITRVLGQDQAVFACRQSPTTSYLVGTVTGDLTVATSVKARVCEQAIAVSSDPDGVTVQVIRTDKDAITDDVDVIGDLITISTLADVFTDQAVGDTTATVYQIAAAHRSVIDGGGYRCYVFFDNGRSVSTGQIVKYNWVDTSGALGTQANFIRGLGTASRAFDRNGQVYVNLAFAGVSDTAEAVYGRRVALQNSYFLYRDDGLLVAKQTMLKAGGFPVTTCHLPSVVVDEDDENAYAWCGTERRVIPIGGSGSDYSDRGPRDITLTFDSNEARRCVRLGQTLYIAGGEIMQYDGTQLVEAGFHTVPHFFGLLQSDVSGDVAAGTYGVTVTERWNNARGEVDRSTSAITAQIEISGATPNAIAVGDIVQLYATHKTHVALEVWRTLKDPTDDAPLYLVSSADPTSTASSNGYLENDPTDDTASFIDELADDVVAVLGQHPENGGALENLAPPAATIIITNDERLFLAGVAGDPDRVWYSKKRNDGEVAAFHDALAVSVPSEGGAITALAFLNETLVVFRETAIYVLPGDGFDNTGGGSNYGPARIISTDVGAVNHESVAVTGEGLIFDSNKGWHVLTRGWGVQYIGAPVTDYDDHTPLAVDVIEAQHQIRILVQKFGFPPVFAGDDDVIALPGLFSVMLVLDTHVGQWGVWSITNGVHACMWRGSHLYLDESGPLVQGTTYDGVDYGFDIETAWIKGDLQGAQRVRRIEILGEYLSASRLQVRLARDYWKDGVDTYFQDKLWTIDPTDVGGPLQVKHGPSIQQVQALKVRLTAVHVSDDDASPAGGAMKLTGLALELGFKPGLYRNLPSTQKQ